MDQTPETQASSDTASAGATAVNPNARESVALSSGRGGIVGIKAGMTQVYTDNGDSLAVTVIDLQQAVITQVKTKSNDGYQAVQVGMMPRKSKSVTKAEAGHVKASGATGFYHYQEFRMEDGAKMDGLTVGKVLSPEFVKAGDLVDVTSISKGKGFQGGMKRHHFSGNYKSHGCSVSHRSIGSIGNRADPGRVFKGKPMAGHMGLRQVTVQNLIVVRVDMENQLLLVHGSVPGPKSGIVTVRRAVKG